MRRAAILVVLTLLGASACSRDFKAPVQASGRPITTTGAPATTTTEKPAPLPTKAQLEAKLLTLRDLPSYWRVSKPTDDPSADPACFKALDDGASKATVKADFASGNGFPVIGEQLDTYPSDKVGPELDKAEHIMDGCGSFTFSSAGIDFSGKLTRIASFPTYGDRTVAWDMALQARGVVFHLAVVMVAEGTTALTFTYGVQGDDAVSPAQTYLSAATAKL